VDGVTRPNGETFFQRHIQPSIAIKFLRDGEASANYLGMTGFEDQGQGNDFFSIPFTNHLPVAEGDCGPASILKWHNRASRWVFSSGTRLMAHFDEHGNDERDDARYPFEVVFEKIEGNLPVTDETVERFFDHIPRVVDRETDIFQVWARDEARSASNRDSSWERIGKLRTKSDFIQSLWGDERLFF